MAEKTNVKQLKQHIIGKGATEPTGGAEPQKGEKLMNSEQQAKAVFVSFCIEQYAKAKDMPTEDVVKLFEQYGIAEHFCEFYDVLHTQGHQWLIEEIDKMINDRKK